MKRKKNFTCKILLVDHNPDMVVLFRYLVPNYSRHDTAIVIHIENTINHEVIEHYEREIRLCNVFFLEFNIHRRKIRSVPSLTGYCMPYPSI